MTLVLVISAVTEKVGSGTIWEIFESCRSKKSEGKEKPVNTSGMI
jgi:hypothetical protein